MTSQKHTHIRHSSIISFTSAFALLLAAPTAVAQETAPAEPEKPAPAAPEKVEPTADAGAQEPVPEADPEPEDGEEALPEDHVEPVAAGGDVSPGVALDASAVAPEPEAVAVEPSVAPAEAEPPAEADSGLPKALKIGDSGHLKFSSLMQGWFLLENQSDLQDNSDTSTTFRIRRAEIKLKGEFIEDTLKFALMVDPAKTLKFGSEARPVEPAVAPLDPAEADPPSVDVTTPPSDTSILQDFYITAVTDFADVSIGQFKIPMSYEGSNSSSELLLPERSPASKLYGDKRDIGLRVEKEFGPVHYVATLVNGRGRNRLDNNNQKEFYGRLEYSPIEWLMLAGAGGTAIGERGTEETTKDRLEGDLRLDVANVLVQFEYLHGWDGATGSSQGTRIEGHGFYGALGYTILDKIQPVFRVSYVDEDIDSDGTRLWQYDGGVNYFVSGNNVKLSASYAYTDADGEEPLHTGTAAVQLKY